MNTRPVAAAFFVVFCLLLCGLILHRQIAAHPLPPDTGPQYGQGQPDYQSWQPAAPAMRAQVREIVQEELDALRDGNGPKAMSLQSREMRQRFSGSSTLLQIISSRHPELFHFRQVEYGPVSTDQSGRNVRALFFVNDENGQRIPEGFLLTREGGRFKIIHFRPQWPPN